MNLKKSGMSRESPRNSLKAVEFLMNQMKQYAKRKSLIKMTVLKGSHVGKIPEGSISNRLDEIGKLARCLA